MKQTEKNKQIQFIIKLIFLKSIFKKNKNKQPRSLHGTRKMVGNRISGYAPNTSQNWPGKSLMYHLAPIRNKDAFLQFAPNGPLWRISKY